MGALEIRKLSEIAGAEVLGVDFRHDPDAETVEAINRAFLDHHILCIRDQDIAPDRLLAVARCFGTVQVQHVKQFAHPDTDLISVLSRDLNKDRPGEDGKKLARGTTWHTDHSYFRRPNKATMLHALQVPSKGGDTRFINMQRVYEDLPQETKARIEGLMGVHNLAGRRNRTGRRLTEEQRREAPRAVHPLVRTHDDTGRKALYINPNRMDGIEGLSDAESDALLDSLERAAQQPHYEYRHHYRPFDVVLWDNRCLMHAATDDYDEPRYLHRILLEGDVPH